MKIIKKRLRHSIAVVRRKFVYFGAVVIQQFVLLFPLKFSIIIGEFLGNLAFWLVGKERKKTIYNLNTAFGNSKDADEKKKIAREVFKNCGRMAAEIFYLPKYDEKLLRENITLVGSENIDRAFASGKGVVGVTAHFGNWELMGGYFSIICKIKFAVIARKLSNPWIDELLNKFRESKGVAVIFRGAVVREIFRRLHSNESIAILGDIDTKGDGIFVDYFGKPAYTQRGIAEIVIRTGAVLVPVFIVRQSNILHHTIFAEKPLDISLTGDSEKDIHSITQLYTDSIEQYVQNYPEQWMWMHNRWKRKKKTEKKEKGK